MSCGKYNEALDFAGRSLLIRVKQLGVMHEKTAESHFNIGVLYRILGDLFNSKKELSISKGINIQLHGDLSLVVSTCYLELGQTELQSMAKREAYVSYYKSYRIR